MITCGIDPGTAGGIAFLDNDDLVLAAPLPYVTKKADVHALTTMLNLYEPDRVLIERQQIRQGQGGAMTIGTNYGRLLACIELAGLRYKEVTPNQWKKKAGIPTGVTGKEKKEASYECCCRTFGHDQVMHHNLRTNKDGPCDAALIAFFGGWG